MITSSSVKSLVILLTCVLYGYPQALAAAAGWRGRVDRTALYMLEQRASGWLGLLQSSGAAPGVASAGTLGKVHVNVMVLWPMAVAPPPAPSTSAADFVNSFAVTGRRCL